MEVRLAALADYANVSQEGKLNILGVFGEINPPMLPFPLPTMYLVVSFFASPAEIGTTKDVAITLRDSDGNEVVGFTQVMEVPSPKLAGTPSQMNVVLALNGVSFERSGDYRFYILVGGESKWDLGLRVNEPKDGAE